MKWNRLGSALCVIASALLCGCVGGCMGEMHHGEDMDDNNASRPVWNAIDKQSALGARDEATLNAADFTAGELNGLGMAHVDAMMQEKPGPAVVYVNLDAKDSMTAARRDATAKYLAQLSSEGMHAPRVEVGMNTAMGHLASDGISHMSKTENPPLGSTESNGSNTQGTSQTTTGGGMK